MNDAKGFISLEYRLCVLLNMMEMMTSWEKQPYKSPSLNHSIIKLFSTKVINFVS